MERTAVYAGSFDPVTTGHIDIIERSCRNFDRVIVAVVHNVTKMALFSLEERVEMIKQSTSYLANVEVDSFSGLLVDYVAKQQAGVIIRGLRSQSDFEYEMQLAMMNSHLFNEVETFFIMCRPEYLYISSSGVKEAALLGGKVGGLVPESVIPRLNAKRELFEQGKL
ncbi:MAG: pantetheine-phosphate adenylyltransferase [Methylocystaceae bacterium]